MSRRRCCGPPRLPLGFAGGAAVLEPPPNPPPQAGEGSVSLRRHLALVFPDLPIARLRRAGLEGPVIVWRASGPRREVVAAEAPLIRPGQPLGDARALCPEARLVEEDAAADRAFLESLALWALRFTPLVATSGDRSLILDITGCAHLFGGEAALLRRVREGLARGGVPAIGAIAGAPGCAAALARAGIETVVPEGGEAAAVADLPLSALPVEPDTIAALSRIGLRRVGEVRRQPRGPLARRFGAALLLALDEAAGEAVRPISPIRPAPELEAARNFLEPIITREAIDIAADALLRELCARLTRAGRAARRFTLRAFRVDGAVGEVVLGTGLATRDPAHLARLLAHRIETLEPGFGFDRMTLGADRTESFTGLQPGLSREGGEEALAQLLDRLAQRVALWRLAPQASHWPEREVLRVSPFAPVALLEGWPLRPRPVRLLRHPVAIGVMALLPDAPPSLIRIGERSRRVVSAEGPERLAAEWWREDRPDRDYYRVEIEGGARLWLCRIGFGADARWFIHGYFG
jgi:protein ImuB